MYTQLIRYLERKPEKYSQEGSGNIQTLLLMDEFARFGKLKMITSALSTLRSKNMNICIFVQSIAQLDSIYGEHDRRIIFDNCQYKAILRAGDAETQKYLCELIGTYVCVRRSISQNMDESLEVTGYNLSISEVRELAVQPHELSTLNGILLLTPYGFFLVKKVQPSFAQNDIGWYSPYVIRGHMKTSPSLDDPPIPDAEMKMNEGAKILAIEERSRKAADRTDAAERQHRVKERQEENERKKKENQRNCAIGAIVVRYFPELSDIEPGHPDENEVRFKPLRMFLEALSADQKLVTLLKEKAHQLETDG